MITVVQFVVVNPMTKRIINIGRKGPTIIKQMTAMIRLYDILIQNLAFSASVVPAAITGRKKG